MYMQTCHMAIYLQVLFTTSTRPSFVTTDTVSGAQHKESTIFPENMLLHIEDNLEAFHHSTAFY